MLNLKKISSKNTKNLYGVSYILIFVVVFFKTDFENSKTKKKTKKHPTNTKN